MPRLFLRIFLTFLLGLLLNLVLFVTVSLTLRREPLFARYLSFRGEGTALQYYAETISEAYTSGGVERLERCRERTEKDTHLHLFLFGPEGQILSRRLPSTASTQLAQAVFRNKIVGHPRLQLLDLRCAVLVYSGGKPFVLVTEEPGGLSAHITAPLTRVGLVLTVALVICALLARHLTEPIRELQQTTRRLAEGDLTARPGKAMRRRDEIGALARDFDRMAVRLTDAIAGQRRLLADVSHELRSPLARLNVAVELARRRHRVEDRGILLDRIEREAERMNMLIGELLMLSRLESSTTQEFLFRAVDLAELIAGIVADADFEARSLSRHIEFDQKEAERIIVRGEPELLRRAVENVVRNALRYTEEGTIVRVSLHRSGDTAEVLVQDQGPGVPEAQLADLFRPFYRVEGDRDRATGGVGLGLAITERAIVIHGGSVRAENSEAGGFLVVLSLPLAAVDTVQKTQTAPEDSGAVC